MHKKVSKSTFETSTLLKHAKNIHEKSPTFSNIPNVLILGVQKAGTTFLSRLLRKQDEMYSYPSEAHYFDHCSDTCTLQGYSNLLRNFSTPFGHQTYNPEVIDSPIIVEKTPEYIHLPKRIVPVMPNDTKYIVALRNPIDRTYSQYKMKRRKYGVGDERHRVMQLRTFEEALMDHPTRPFRLVSRGLYGNLLEKWYSMVPAENILVLFYEDFQSYDWTKLANFLGMKKPISVPKIRAPTSYADVIRKETYKKLIHRFKNSNQKLCNVLRTHNYTCPKWADQSRHCNSTNPPVFSLMTTHKWGNALTKKLQTQVWPCSYVWGRITPKHLSQTKKHVVIARNVFDAIVSGYLYHKRGSECTMPMDQYYPLDWTEYISKTNIPKLNSSVRINVCKMLSSVSEQVGISLYAEFAYNRYVKSAVDTHKQKNGHTTMIVCMEQILRNETESLREIDAFLNHSRDSYPTIIPAGKHATTKNATTRTRLRNFVVNHDKNVLNDTIMDAQNMYNCQR